MSNVGFDCPHDSYKWDQAPAPGGVGIVIVGQCNDCGAKLSQQQIQALSAKKTAIDGALSQLRSTGQNEKAQALETAMDGIKKVRTVARRYTQLMESANEAQAAQASLPLLCETIPDSTWRALGLPAKDMVRATVDAMLNPIEQLRALPAMPMQDQQAHNDWIQGEVVRDTTGQPVFESVPGRMSMRDDRVAVRDDGNLIDQLKNASPEQQARIRQLLNGSP